MAYKYGVYLLPKQLDEKVAELHFPALGAALTVFAREHPSSFLPDVVVFHEPVLLQLALLTYSNDTTAYKDEVYLFSKELDEEVAKLHIPALGAVLTVLIQIKRVSSLKALSSVGTTVIELNRFSRRFCRWQRIGP